MKKKISAHPQQKIDREDTLGAFTVAADAAVAVAVAAAAD